MERLLAEAFAHPAEMFEVTTYASIADVPDDVARAASYERHGDLFRSIEWFGCLEDTVIGSDSRSRIYVARDGAGLPAGLMACHQPAGDRVLHGMSNYYSLEFGPLLVGEARTGGDPRGVIEAIVGHIADERPRWPAVRVDTLRSDRRDADDIEAALRGCRFHAVRTQEDENWYLDAAGLDFDSYFASRSSRLRTTIPREERRLKRSHGLEIRIFDKDDAELDDAIDAYTSVYNRSWKEAEPHPRFMPAFMRLCADLSILRLGIARIDGMPAAAQLWINSGDRSYIYKIAYDEAFKRLSVGAVLSRAMFQNALDVDRVREIDYGIGSEPYKQEWMSGMRTLESVQGYRLGSPSGVVRLGWSSARRGVSRLRDRFRRS